MPLPFDELSVFFNRLSKALEKKWDIGVDDGEMTDQALHRRLIRMDAICQILEQLADGHAVLTYPKRSRRKEEEPSREPSPLIRLPRAGGNDE